jgi:eukaryotic-like serine/threonine-protein kinase
MPNVMPLQADDPRRVGRYRLTGRMGSRTGVDGSTLRVFTAKMVDGDTVLVTLLGSDRVADAAARDRFTAEARVARRVAPFCVARILDAGIEGGDPYLVAEYVPGPTLTEAVGSDGPLPQRSLEAFAIGTATGLMAIHQTGLVHGELGPEHVVLGPDGPRVTHFGITPPYGAATPAADVLAWANTVLFAAVGRRPAGPQDLAALADDLREVLAACLVPDAGSRPVARAVLIQLLGQRDLSSGLLAEGSRRARAAARLPEPSPPARQPAAIRSRSGAVLWAVAFAVCVFAFVAAVVFISRPTRPRAPSPTPAWAARAGGTSSPSRGTGSPWTRPSAAGGRTVPTASSRWSPGPPARPPSRSCGPAAEIRRAR